MWNGYVLKIQKEGKGENNIKENLLLLLVCILMFALHK